MAPFCSTTDDTFGSNMYMAASGRFRLCASKDSKHMPGDHKIFFGLDDSHNNAAIRT